MKGRIEATAVLQSCAKIMRIGHFKVRRPPPCPHDQCCKKWVEFSLFSLSHNIELGVRGTLMRLSQSFLLLIVGPYAEIH
jgi:hypothetical protein